MAFADLQSASFEQHVFVRLLRQNVGRLCDGTQSGQASSDLQLGPFPELLLLLLNLLQPGRAENLLIYCRLIKLWVSSQLGKKNTADNSKGNPSAMLVIQNQMNPNKDIF